MQQPASDRQHHIREECAEDVGFILGMFRSKAQGGAVPKAAAGLEGLVWAVWFAFSGLGALGLKGLGGYGCGFWV